jgi:(E)-4-hydroxy-3-methylbut-2-enyl-diphosphate synthase
VEEVKVGFDILKSLHIRSKGVNIIACPSCSRQEFDVIKTVNALEARLEDVLEHMDVSVLGCVVNGPGEAREADIGVAGGSPSLLYIEGKPARKVTEEEIVDEIERQVRARIARMKQAQE